MPEYLETTVDKFIFRVATDRFYGPQGIWAMEIAGSGRLRLGLTDYLQQQSGDVAFVHLKPSGTSLAAGDAFADLETIKATLELLCPVSGEIVEVNEELSLSPEIINQDPYGKGWLVTLQPSQWNAERATLLDPQAYLAAMRAQAEKELNQ